LKKLTFNVNPDAFYCLQRHSLADVGSGNQGGSGATPTELQSQHSSIAPVGTLVQQKNERAEGTTAIDGGASILNRWTSCISSTGKKGASMRETTTQTFRASHYTATPDVRNPTSKPLLCKSGLGAADLFRSPE
jgi:hypothetical protein